jgi:hypothetical protein
MSTIDTTDLLAKVAALRAECDAVLPPYRNLTLADAMIGDLSEAQCAAVAHIDATVASIFGGFDQITEALRELHGQPVPEVPIT